MKICISKSTHIKDSPRASRGKFAHWSARLEEEPVLAKSAIGEYYKKLVADPHFVPFTLTVNWNSFHVVDDIAIATSVFDGDVTRNGKQIHFRGKNLLVWKKQTDGSWKIFRYMYDEIPAKK